VKVSYNSFVYELKKDRYIADGRRPPPTTTTLCISRIVHADLRLTLSNPCGWSRTATAVSFQRLHFQGRIVQSLSCPVQCNGNQKHVNPSSISHSRTEDKTEHSWYTDLSQSGRRPLQQAGRPVGRWGHVANIPGDSATVFISSIFILSSPPSSVSHL